MSNYNFLASNKFLKEQHPRHGGNLQWPGIDGIPVRSSAKVDVTQEETQYASLCADFNCKVFNLNNEEDLEYYKWVKDRIVNGWFKQLECHYDYNKEGYPIVYLEWAQLYYEWPDGLIDLIRTINDSQGPT